MAALFAASMLVLAVSGTLPNWLEWGTAVAQLLGFTVLVLPVGIYLWATESRRGRPRWANGRSG